MRIVAPYTAFHPLAEQALTRHAPTAERVPLGDRPDAYYRFLRELWEAGESFHVVEHDIEIHAGVVDAECAEPWCVWPYRGPGRDAEGAMLTRSLGCTRFHRDLLTAHPDLLAGFPVGHGVNFETSPRNWRRVDSELAPRLQGLGYKPHQHEPVLHHHVYNETGCACGSEHPDLVDPRGTQ